MRSSRSDLVAACVLVACIGSAHADSGDAARGIDVFASECSDCHSVRAGLNKKGPSLHGVVGRKAANLPDFKYSDAMRASGWTWDLGHLRTYLARPKRALPGGRMKYEGLPDAQAMNDLLAYLGTLK